MRKANVVTHFVFTIVLAFSALTAFGQLSITAVNTPVGQNFNTLATSGTGGQSGGAFAEGWSFWESGALPHDYQAGTGSSNTGDTYSFGILGINAVTDRALGMLQSSSQTTIIGFKFTNNTSQIISSFQVAYTGELWRLSSGVDELSFSYQVGNVALNATSGWTTVPELGFTTPVTGSLFVDGNSGANRTVISPVTITGLYLLPGATVTCRWIDATATSSAGMAIDDFSISLIPASTAYFRTRASGNWNDVTVWETSVNGAAWTPATTTVPTDKAAGITILPGHLITITSDLTISKLVVKAGGKISYEGGSLIVTDSPGDDLLLEAANSVFETAGPVNPVLNGNATIRVGNGAVMLLSGNNNLLNYHSSAYVYADGAVFEYANVSAPNITGTFFSSQDPGAVPVFRFNSSGTANLGSAGGTTVNGKIEVSVGRTLNLNGVTGTLVVRNGIRGSGDLKAIATIHLTGATAELGGAGTINSNLTVENGCTATLSSGKSFANNNAIVVNGILDAGTWQLQSLNGTASFSVGSNGIVKTANAAGLVNTTGTLKTSSFTVNLSTGSTIDYNAAANQLITITGSPAYLNLKVSGSGIKSVQSGANLVVQGSCTVGTGATLALSGLPTNDMYLNNNAQLQVQSGGTFDNGGESTITSSGGSPTVVVSGKFITRDPQGFIGTGAALPTIVPVLNGNSTVEYGHTGDQAVQATINYGNLVFSGSGIKTPTNAVSLTGTVTVSGPVVLNGTTHSIGGAGNALVMMGTSRYRVGGTGTKPDLGGSYTLAPTSTIEFTNYNQTTCDIRQGGPNIQYANVEITGSNVTAPLSGINLQAGTTFTVKNGGGLKLTSVNGLYGASNAAILSANNPTVVLEAGSAVEYNGTNQVLSTGFNYSHVKISGTGVKTASSVFTVSQSFTRSGGTLLGGASPSFQPNAVLNYVDAGAGTTYTAGPEWPSVNPPTNVTVNLTGNGNPSVVLGSDKAVAGLVNIQAGSVNLNDKTLSVNSGISGTGSLIGSSRSSLLFNGGTTSLNFLQTTDAATNALGTLTVNSGAVTLSNRLNIYEVLNIAGGSLNVNNQSLVLKSTEQQTARVAERKGTLTGVTNVTVERFVTSLRRWRLLTAPVLNTSINAAWQEGRKWNGALKDNSSPGFGTLITGQQQILASAANSKGFDFWTAIANSSASIRRYKGATNFTQATWQPLDNTTTTGAFDQHEAYLLFVRGDRSVATETGGATVLRARGALKEPASVSVPVAQNQSHTLVGNPFASPIDFKKIYEEPVNTGTIQPYFWLWQASLGASGGYLLVKPDGSGGYEAVPGGSNALTPVSPVISSGEGFFVLPITKPTATNLVIRQAHKTGAAPLHAAMGQGGGNGKTRKENPVAKLAGNLYIVDLGATLLLDGILAEYKLTAAKKDDNIRKAVNSTENLAIFEDGSDMIASSKPLPKPGDSLRLRLWNTTFRNYQLELVSANFAGTGLTATLVDRYLKKEVSLDLSGGRTLYSFTINADGASRDPLRFVIVFKPRVEVPPSLINVKAAVIDNREVAVSWTIGQESGIKAYILERSFDNISFTTLANVTAKAGSGEQSYSFLDRQPSQTNYYRVKLLGSGGEVTNSVSVNAELRAAGETILVSPNPVKGGSFRLSLISKPKGSYTVSLYNLAGQKVFNQMIHHNGGTASWQIHYSGAAGLYQLQVRDGPGKNQSLLFTIENE